MAASSGVASELRPFPAETMVPRDETRAREFVEANPEFDGRGVVVGILDTGVDPAAVGLQRTSDGRPKIVDIVDASGSGDVDMPHEVEATVEGESAARTLRGLTGRVLRLNPSWTNPTNKWRLGVKRAVELWPAPVRSRVARASKDAFEREQERLVIEAERALAALKAAAGTPKLEVAEAQARVDALRGASAAEDVGPTYDVVAWQDAAGVWRAAVDTSLAGDLTRAPGLTNFRAERQWATLDAESQLSYCVNLYDAGRTVCIVCDGGSHGTHVAGIVAAHNPDAPALDGVAPGAQIVAIKIGDTRIGTMETPLALCRAVRAVIESGCDLINMSYGEPGLWPNRGRFIDLVKNAVREKGILFIGSAGNNGPALTTVGAPGGVSSAYIGVGALISPTMSESEYSARRGSPTMPFTWSSRGPTLDGDLGVTVCAPGAAIAPVPIWGLKRNDRMNGTSMSSPNCAGCVALLLSALKQRKLAFTPYSVTRALQNGASHVPGSDVWSTGAGLVDVVNAWRVLQERADRADREKAAVLDAAHYTFDTTGWQGIDAAAAKPSAVFRGTRAPAASASASASSSSSSSSSSTAPSEAAAEGLVGAARFEPTPTDADMVARGLLGERGEDWTIPDLDVEVAYMGAGPGAAEGRGVYLREAAQGSKAAEVTVSVTPRWKEGVHPRVRIFFQRVYALVSSAPSWIQAPAHFYLSATSKTFAFFLDPRALPAGAHYGEIRAYAIRPEVARTHGSGGGGGGAGEASAAGASAGAALSFDEMVEPGGPDFVIPITVIRPDEAESTDPNGGDLGYTFTRVHPDQKTHTSTHSAGAGDRGHPVSSSVIFLAPGSIERRFVNVPDGASWCDVTVRRVDPGVEDDEWALRAARGDADAAAHLPSSFLGAASASKDDAEGKGEEEATSSTPSSSPSSSRVVDTTARLLVLHAVQAIPNVSLKESGHEEYYRLRPGEEGNLAVPVVSNHTLEIALAQYWSALGSTAVLVTVRFRGARVEGRLDAHPGDGALRLDVLATLHDILVAPTASLTHWVRLIAPRGAEVGPAGERDYGIRGVPLSRLELTYGFSAVAPTTVKCWLGRVHNVLYETPFESQVLLISDDRNMLVGMSDCFADDIKLPAAGEYTIRVQLMHPSAATLETLKAEPLCLRVKLDAPLTLTAHLVAGSAAVGDCTYAKRRLKRGIRDSIFLALPATSALPKGYGVGDQLVGTANVCDYSSTGHGSGNGRHPDGEARIRVTLPAPPAASSAAAPATNGAAGAAAGGAGAGAGGGGAAGGGGGPSVDEVVAAAVRDASIAALGKLSDPAAFERLFGSLVETNPTHVPLLRARLDFEDKDWPTLRATASAERITAAADALVATVDIAALAGYWGLRHDADDAASPADTAELAKRTEEKNLVVEATFRRARALARFAAAGLRGEPLPTEAGADAEAFAAALAECRKWADVSKGKYALLTLESHLRAGRWALAHAVVAKATDLEVPKAAQRTLKRALLSQLGWAALRAADERDDEAHSAVTPPRF